MLLHQSRIRTFLQTDDDDNVFQVSSVCLWSVWGFRPAAKTTSRPGGLRTVHHPKQRAHQSHSAGTRNPVQTPDWHVGFNMFCGKRAVMMRCLCFQSISGRHLQLCVLRSAWGTPGTTVRTTTQNHSLEPQQHKVFARSKKKPVVVLSGIPNKFPLVPYVVISKSWLLNKGHIVQ